MTFGEQLFFEEILLSGFGAVAWLRATGMQASDAQMRWIRILKLPGRIERLQRSRWQWFSLVALMLVLRLQGALLPAAEVVAAMEFIVFLAWPVARGAETPGSDRAVSGGGGKSCKRAGRGRDALHKRTAGSGVGAVAYGRSDAAIAQR